MTTRMIVELPDGHKILFGSAGRTGLGEISATGAIATKSKEQFQKALGSLAGLVKAMEESVGKLPSRPDEIEMEFGATLTADCNLWIVAGEAETEFKITLKWTKPE